MTTHKTAEQLVSSDTIDAYHQRIKLAYDLVVADCDDHDHAILRASVAAATFAMSSADAARYARRQLPQSGGYACDDDGIMPADTVRTIAETDYNHEQAMACIASLLRSHEALRTRADTAERRVEAVKSLLDETIERMPDGTVIRIHHISSQTLIELQANLAAASGAAYGAATTEGIGMGTIHKAKADSSGRLAVPHDAKILTAQMQRGEIVVWYITHGVNSPERRIAIVGTGHPCKHDRQHYIATVQSGLFVWHLFEDATTEGGR